MIVNRSSLIKDSETFKNVEKDLSYIISKISQDEKLLKLLSLQEERSEKLSEKEKQEILKECVKIVPKVSEEEMSEKGWANLTIQFSQFLSNQTNPEHRDKFLVFNIICNFDTVNMGDFQLRPYLIAGRLDGLFDKKSLCGTYSINFLNADTITLNEDYFGMGIVYSVVYSKGSDKDEGLE